jgi:hypothetical protein
MHLNLYSISECHDVAGYGASIKNARIYSISVTSRSPVTFVLFFFISL